MTKTAMVKEVERSLSAMFIVSLTASLVRWLSYCSKSNRLSDCTFEGNECQANTDAIIQTCLIS